MNQSREKDLPLTSIKVLDITRLIPGAYCTLLLGDLGAEVVKIEEPGVGDYDRTIPPFIKEMASRFLLLNRNKKSISLDLKQEDGCHALKRIASHADVLIEGFRPGVMTKLGLDFDNMHRINPRLVYCSISSFGQDGPYRDRVAHDLNILGMTGICAITGTKDGVPAIPGIQIVDSMAGISAALAILAALIKRDKSGEGQWIDLSMFDCALSLIFDTAKNVFADMPVPAIGRGRLSGGLPNYNIYETKDATFITVAALETKFKNALLSKLGLNEFITPEDQKTSTAVKESDEHLYRRLCEVFLTKTRDEWMEEFGPMNICVGPVNSIGEALSHPQAISRKMVIETQHPVSDKMYQIGSFIKGSDFMSDALRTPAPHLGEHTRSILIDVGFNPTDIERMIKKKAVFEAR